MKAESAAHVAQLLRTSDRDRYLSTLIVPDAPRPAVTALYAFNLEIASVSERVRDPAAGEIRLRWWADALSGAGHGDVRSNPVADALLSVIEDYRLPTAGFERMIEARRFDLYQDPMPDMPSFEGYAGDTTSALYQLAAMILNAGRPVESGDAAGHLGVAHALIGHLRAFGYNASRGRIFLPWDVFATCGVSEAELFAGTQSPGLAVALTRFSEMASMHLSEAGKAVERLPRHLRPAFGAMAMLRIQLRRLDFESPFQSPRDLPDWYKVAVLAAWRLGR